MTSWLWRKGLLGLVFISGTLWLASAEVCLLYPIPGYSAVRTCDKLGQGQLSLPLIFSGPGARYYDVRL